MGAGPGIDVYSMRQPLGVVAGITPFNFPAMIPMWMFGVAIACGNAFILKPSERDPSLPLRLGELMLEAGLPPGILNVVHGDKVAVDAILDHPDIKAVSFVGSSDIAHYVSSRGSGNGKRVQAMGGAKNHGIVLPDADMDQTVADLVGAAFGSAGERCMALPVVVPVGKATADELRERLLPEIARLRLGVSTDADAHYGPVVSAAHRDRIESYIGMGVADGAELVVDGRGFSLQGHEGGFFVGPTLFDHVKPTMQSYQDEIFGPVLQMVRADSLAEAIKLPQQAPVWQRRRDLHPQRPRRARVRRDRRRRHGRDQRADPGAGRVPQLRRVEAQRIRRHRHPRHRGRQVLHQAQDRHPALAGPRRGRAGDRQQLRHSDDEVGVAAMRIGFIGLGNMGGGMAANLVAGGHAVTAFDLSAAALDRAAAAGCTVAASASAAVAGADAVVTMLPAGSHVRSVYEDAGVRQRPPRRVAARLLDDRRRHGKGGRGGRRCQGAGDGRCAGVGRDRRGERGNADVHGRRAGRCVRPRPADPRAHGQGRHPRRRRRGRAGGEDLQQSAARRVDGRHRRGVRAGGEAWPRYPDLLRHQLEGERPVLVDDELLPGPRPGPRRTIEPRL